MLNLTRPAAEYLRKQLGLSQDETEIALYGLQVLTYSLAGILTICLVGWLLGCFWTTLAVALTAGSLRLVSGGAHSSSPLICNLLGMFLAPILAKSAEFAALRLPPVLLFIIVISGAVLSLLVFYLLAPVDSPAKPISSDEERRKFHRLTITLTAVIILGQISFLAMGHSPSLVLAVSLGTWWQAFSLTGAGHRFASFVDHFFIKGV